MRVDVWAPASARAREVAVERRITYHLNAIFG